MYGALKTYGKLQREKVEVSFSLEEKTFAICSTDHSFHFNSIAFSNLKYVC